MAWPKWRRAIMTFANDAKLGVQSICARAGLPSTGTRPGGRNELKRITSNAARTKAQSKNRDYTVCSALVRPWLGPMSSFEPQKSWQTPTKQGKWSEGHQESGAGALALWGEAGGPGAETALGHLKAPWWLQRGDWGDEARLFTKVPSRRTRESGISHQLKLERFGIEIRKLFFSSRTRGGEWGPGEVLPPWRISRLSCLKPEATWSDPMYDSALSRRLKERPPEVPSNLNYSSVLWFSLISDCITVWPYFFTDP